MKKKHSHHHAHAVKRKALRRRHHPKARMLFFAFFRTSAIVIVLGIGASLLALDPSVITSFQASIIGEVTPIVEEGRQPMLEAVLLTHKSVPENEAKLSDVFQNVFSGLRIRRVSKDEDEGKTLVETFAVKEFPTMLFEKTALEKEQLFSSVKDLLEEVKGWYVLKTPLINPSFQARLDLPETPSGSYPFGSDSAPVKFLLFSSVTCADCRVLERSLISELASRLSLGTLELTVIDLPEEEKDIPFSSSLSCAHQKLNPPASYFAFREKLVTRPNLSSEYVDLELKRAGLAEGLKACDLSSSRPLHETRLSIAERFSFTSLPTVYIGKTGSPEWIRISGAKELEVYKNVLDR